MIAAGGYIYPTEKFNYFVVGVIENIPENTIASFHIIPFAITLGGKYLYGNTTLYSSKEAQPIDYVAFEAPAHTSTSSHIYHAALSENRANYTFACAFSQCNVSFTVPKDQVIGSYVTGSTDSRLGNSQTPFWRMGLMCQNGRETFRKVNGMPLPIRKLTDIRSLLQY